MDAQESPPLGLLIIGALIAAVIVACLAIVLLRGGRSGGWATKFAASIITGAALFAVMGTLHPIAKGVAVVAAVAMIAAALDRMPVRVAAVVAAALIGLSTCSPSTATDLPPDRTSRPCCSFLWRALPAPSSLSSAWPRTAGESLLGPGDQAS